MTSSRGTGVTIMTGDPHGNVVRIPMADRMRLEELLNTHGIKFHALDGGHNSGGGDDVEVVFDGAIDVEAIQEILDDAD